MPAGTARQLPPYHYKQASTTARSYRSQAAAREGGDQAARGRRQAGGAVAAASIDLSAAGCAWGWHATRARILPSDDIRFGRRVRGGRGRHGY